MHREEGEGDIIGTTQDTRSPDGSVPGEHASRQDRLIDAALPDGDLLSAQKTGAQAVARALSILMCYSFDSPILSVSEIATRANLKQPTAHRLIRTLVAGGFMRQRTDKKYELGPRLHELGLVARNQLGINSLAAEAVSTLARETRETVILGQADYETLEVMFVDMRPGSYALRVLPPGRFRPLLPPGPMGRALLAALRDDELDKVLEIYARRGADEREFVSTGSTRRQAQQDRELGYVIDDQDYMEGVTGVSSWIFYGEPRSIAAITVVAPSPRLQGDQRRLLGERVRDLAVELSFRRDR